MGFGVIYMNSKLFAIKIPENEKMAMDYISSATTNALSKIFYGPIQDALYTNLGLILIYKIDLRNITKISDLREELLNKDYLSNRSLPIIEDFVRLMLDKTQQEIAGSMSRGRGEVRHKSCICKIETGQRAQRTIRGSLLYQLAEVYGTSITEVLKAANWTQLPLLDVTEEETQELLRHLEQLRKRERHQKRKAKE